jgi:LysM repeat protein
MGMTKQKLQLYYVEGGDTLYTIAKRFNTTEQEIRRFNNPWFSRLSAGLKLWVPDNRIGTKTSSVTDEIENIENEEAQETAKETGLRATTSDIVSIDISPRKIAYMGNAAPGYLTVKLKTTAPTRGDIAVTGNSQTAKIILSATEYKTEHLVFWAPINEQTKQPLPPGQYSLSLNLYKQNGEKSLGIPQGDIVVIHEANPLPAIDKVTAEPAIISPKLNSTEPLLTITFRVNRPVEVTPYVHGHLYYKHYFPYMTLMPGIHSITWNGRSGGNIMPVAEYRVYFDGKDLTLSENQYFTVGGETFWIRDAETGIPESRIKEVIKGIKIDQSTIAPYGDTNKDVLTGSITLNENAQISLYVINAIRYTVKDLIFQQNLEAGTHSFSWDGRSFMGSALPNGTYSFMATLFEKGTYGDLYFPEVKFNIIGSNTIKPAYPIQNVQITARYTQIELATSGAYLAVKGNVYPIIDYMPGMSWKRQYRIMLTDGVEGFVDVGDVDWIDLDKIPLKWGRVIKAGAEVKNPTNTQIGVIEYLPLNTTVRILNKEGDMYRIVLTSGKQGYIKEADLQQVVSPEPQPPVPPSSTVHIVALGDTLWKIAQKYAVTIDAIVQANNLNPSSYLVIGQKLSIPSKIAVAPLIYYVQSGDSFWKIAQTYGVTVNDLVMVNRLDINYPLWVNQKIIIPKVYLVTAGDTLWKIAQKHNTTIQKLLQINGIDVNKPLYIGQRILIGL